MTPLGSAFVLLGLLAITLALAIYALLHLTDHEDGCDCPECRRR